MNRAIHLQAQAKALAELVSMHTESVAAGLADLERANAEVQKVKATFAAIQQLCKQSDVLSNTEHQTALNLAMAHVRSNLVQYNCEILTEKQRLDSCDCERLAAPPVTSMLMIAG
jgi:hypothetical protein